MEDIKKKLPKLWRVWKGEAFPSYLVFCFCNFQLHWCSDSESGNWDKNQIVAARLIIVAHWTIGKPGKTPTTGFKKAQQGQRKGNKTEMEMKNKMRKRKPKANPSKDRKSQQNLIRASKSTRYPSTDIPPNQQQLMLVHSNKINHNRSMNFSSANRTLEVV